MKTSISQVEGSGTDWTGIHVAEFQTREQEGKLKLHTKLCCPDIIGVYYRYIQYVQINTV